MREISVRTYSVRRLLNLISERRFAIPEVQREFVWSGRKACALLDSISRNMPIGALLVWETDRHNRNLLRRNLRILPEYDSKNPDIWFLIDGQQRLSVLHQVQRGDTIINYRGAEVNFERVTFNLNARKGKRGYEEKGDREEEGEKHFPYRRPLDGEFISLADILAHNWRSRLRSLSVGKLRRVEECRANLLKYEVPVVFVRTNDVEEVRQSFIRINALGTPVSSADRAFARAMELNLRDRVRDARQRLEPGFTTIPDMTIQLAIALALGQRDVGARAVEAAIAKVGNRLKKEKREKQRFAKKWGYLERALGKAVDYLRMNFGVVNRGFLPSDNMLATLSLFFYWNGGQPNARQKAELRKWFWATAVGQRYTGRGYRDNILADVRFFERLSRRRNARFQFPDRVFKSDVRKADYSRRSGLTNAFFCLLALHRPRYLENGDAIPLEAYAARSNRSNKHHIFPMAQLRRNHFSRKEYNSLCNICLVVGEDNQRIGHRKPASYLEEYRRKKHFARFMRSHLIPRQSDSGLWSKDVRRGYRAFVRERLDLICAAFERQAGIRLFQEG